MPAPTITVEISPINIKAAPPRAADFNVRPNTAAPIVPARPTTGTAGPRVQVVPPSAVPQGLKNAAAPTIGSKITSIGRTAFGIGARAIGIGLGVGVDLLGDLIFPNPVGAGSDQIPPGPYQNPYAQPQATTRRPLGDPRVQTRPKQTSSTSEPVRTPLGDPRVQTRPEPYRPTETPKPAPFDPSSITSPSPRSRPGLGDLVDTPIRSKPVNTDSPFDLTTIDLDRYGGVNLAYPIAQFLNGLGQKLTQVPDLTQIQELVKTIPKATAAAVVPPILDITKNIPGVTVEKIGYFMAPVLIGLGLVGEGISTLGSGISQVANKKLSMSMGAALPTGLAMGAALPTGLGMGAALPTGLAMGAALPTGLAMGAALPTQLAMTAGLPTNLTVSSNLDLTAILASVAALEATLTQTRTALETEMKRCNDINKNHCKKVDEKLDKIKKKQKEKDDDDDRRNPLIQGSGEIVCDDAAIPYAYKGEGLNGLWQAVDIILNLNKQILIRICDLEEDTQTLQGVIAVECDGDTLSYGYSGPGLLGLQSQIQQLSNLNALILKKVCDIDVDVEYPIVEGFGSYVCDGDTLSYGYSGPGFYGLQNQIQQLSSLNALILKKVCDIDVDVEYPTLQGAIAVECDGDTLSYDYSGPGFYGLQNQIQQLSSLNALILKKVCDIDVDVEYPTLQGAIAVECDGNTLSYGYSGPGFYGLQNQIQQLSSLNTLILKKVCDIDVDISYPTLQGGGAYVCGNDTLSYGYSGPGFYGLQSQINEVLRLNAKILEEVCDLDDQDNPTLMGSFSVECGDDTLFYNYSGVGLIGLSDQISRLTQINAKILEEVCDAPDITGQIEYFNCDRETQVLLYSGNGIEGLSNQVQALTALVKDVLVAACDTTCIPLMPDSRFEEFNVTRQLVISWGVNYPTQKGSLWHTSIPMPKDDLNWCDHFENLFIRKGEVCGRLYWENSKIWSGGYFESDDEAWRVLRQFANLSDATPRMKDGDIEPRITNGGAVRRKPAERTVRAVRAVIASINEQGEPTDLVCFVPPFEGC